MANATDLATAEATPIARLIVKAALRWQNGQGTMRATTATLRAYAEVAADVLDAAQTPFAFELAIRESARDHPHPSTTTTARARAVTMREAWQRTIVADVLDRLGNNGSRPTPPATDGYGPSNNPEGDLATRNVGRKS
jgi:hypothetical protein